MRGATETTFRCLYSGVIIVDAAVNEGPKSVVILTGLERDGGAETATGAGTTTRALCENRAL